MGGQGSGWLKHGCVDELIIHVLSLAQYPGEQLSHSWPVDIKLLG